MKQTGKEKIMDKIIDKMINVVENSKTEIFNICEEARMEHDHLQKILVETKEKVIQCIEDGDALEKRVKVSRKRLVKVSRDFNEHDETEVHRVYEKTHLMQTELAMIRQEEKSLQERRDDIERRLISLKQTIDRAEGLSSKISVILPYLHDDFQQVNEMLKDAQQKQAFSLQIIQAQEEERRKLAREIHDGPAQMMANILLRSELVEKAFHQRSVDEALVEIKDVRKMIRSSLQEVRRIIYDLRPMALDDLGLVPTIEKYIGTIADYNAMDIEYLHLGNNERLEQEYEVSFFRLIQESIQNAIKHAEATKMKVKLEITNKLIALAVEDNGKGFDLNKKSDKSFGLVGMNERVEMLHGTLKIHSVKGKGTKIYIRVPRKGMRLN